MYKTHHARSTWNLRCAKNARHCGGKHISKAKVWNSGVLGPLLEVRMWFCVACAMDSAPCQKWAKREGFVAFSKTLAGVGHLKRICKDAFRVAGPIQETSSSEMLGGPALISETGCMFEHQTLRFSKMILRDKRSTSYGMASLFRGRRSTPDRCCLQIAKRIGTRPSALHSTFHF